MNFIWYGLKIYNSRLVFDQSCANCITFCKMGHDINLIFVMCVLNSSINMQSTGEKSLVPQPQWITYRYEGGMKGERGVFHQQPPTFSLRISKGKKWEFATDIDWLYVLTDFYFVAQISSILVYNKTVLHNFVISVILVDEFTLLINLSIYGFFSRFYQKWKFVSG